LLRLPLNHNTSVTYGQTGDRQTDRETHTYVAKGQIFKLTA